MQGTASLHRIVCHDSRLVPPAAPPRASGWSERKEVEYRDREEQEQGNNAGGASKTGRTKV